MTVRHLGDAYEFPSANAAEHYGGDINLYIQWERHLLFACPLAYRVPPGMRFIDFLEQMLLPDYAAHPDTAALDFSRCTWQRDQQPWQPELAKSLADNGVGHMDFLQFRAPGLDGIGGTGT